MPCFIPAPKVQSALPVLTRDDESPAKRLRRTAPFRTPPLLVLPLLLFFLGPADLKVAVLWRLRMAGRLRMPFLTDTLLSAPEEPAVRISHVS